MKLEQNKSDHQKVKDASSNKEKSDYYIQNDDSIQYSIELDKVIYSPNEPINVTITSKNTTDHTIKIWLDAGEYPTGTDLCLFNSQGVSIVDQYWSILSSQSLSEEEVEKLKTTLKPNQEVKKVYQLHSIIQLKDDLTAGTYTLKFNNSQPCIFKVK